MGMARVTRWGAYESGNRVLDKLRELGVEEVGVTLLRWDGREWVGKEKERRVPSGHSITH